MSAVSWHASLLLLKPRTILARLDQLVHAGVIRAAPNLWQLELAVLRMWHRVFFRYDTIGTCVQGAPRPGLRARLLAWRPLRAPFLLWERAIAPLDHTGLGVPPERIVGHLLAAHHDRHQFAYDLSILRATPELLLQLRDEARAVVRGETKRARWLRDLVVFEGYHESLVSAVERTLQGEILVDREELLDPDITFEATIRWCLAQPRTPGETWRAWRRGHFPATLEPATATRGFEEAA